jgi:hypothetical protein
MSYFAFTQADLDDVLNRKSTLLNEVSVAKVFGSCSEPDTRVSVLCCPVGTHGGTGIDEPYVIECALECGVGDEPNLIEFINESAIRGRVVMWQKNASRDLFVMKELADLMNWIYTSKTGKGWAK